MLSKSAFPSKTPQKYLTRQLRSLKILIAKVKRYEREIFPTALIYLKTSKFSKFSKLPKFPNFPIFLNYAKTKLSTPLYFFSFLLAPNVTVPVVLWAEACPFASSSTAVPVHHGTGRFMCIKFPTFSSYGG